MGDMPTSEETQGAACGTRTNRLLRVLLAALSFGMALCFLLSAAKRLHYPYEFSWIEDGLLMSVTHVLHGQPLYAAPTVHYVPYLYTPIYIWLCAFLAKWTGASYATMHLVSIAGMVGCFAVLYAFVWSETRQHVAAMATVGLFAALYLAVNGSYDRALVDALWVFFVLCAIYASRRLHPLLAAVLWVCAFQTKQGVLPIALLFLLHEWRRPRRVLAGVGAFAALLAASIAWMNHATGGWYRYYVFGMAGGFGFNRHQLVHIIPADLLGAVGIALLMAAAVVVVERPSILSRGFSFYLLGSVGMIGFIGYLRGHRGADTNALIPMYAWSALLFGIALARLCRMLEAQRTPAATAAVTVLLLAAGVQIGQHYYSPMQFVPDVDERVARDHFENVLRIIPGDVMVVSHPQYALIAGKSEYAGSESSGAVIDAKDTAKGDKLMAEYAALIHSGTLNAVVTDQPSEYYLAMARNWMPKDFPAYYPVVVTDAGGDMVRFLSQPKYIHFPCPQPGREDAARALDPKADESMCMVR